MKSLRVFVLGAALLAPTLPCWAESFEQAQKTADQRLTKSLQELSRVRGKITKEKIPLSKAVAKLDEVVLVTRKKRDGLLKVRDSRTIDLSSLREQVDSMRGQDEFIDGRLDEFVRDFEGRLDISELPRFENLTRAAKQAEKRSDLDAGSQRAAQLAVVTAALERLGDQLGGQIYPGVALGPDGVLSEGRFAALGPTVFYASEDGTVTGLVENQLNAADPVVVPLPQPIDVATLADGSEGKLPFDPTLGKALKVEKARKSVLEFVNQGGVVGYVIVFLGISALVLAIFKCVEILGFAVAPPRHVDGVLNELAQGDREAASRRAKAIEGVAGDMLETGVRHAGARRGILEELLFEKVLKVRPGLERYLPFLAITAAAAPLLGLLGTVTGMIKTFQLITIFGTGDAKSLSSGISEALVTTAMGLIVAIPTLVLHGALSRMAKRKLGLLEELSVAFVNGVTAISSATAAPAAPGSQDPVDG